MLGLADLIRYRPWYWIQVAECGEMSRAIVAGLESRA